MDSSLRAYLGIQSTPELQKHQDMSYDLYSSLDAFRLLLSWRLMLRRLRPWHCMLEDRGAQLMLKVKAARRSIIGGAYQSASTCFPSRALLPQNIRKNVFCSLPLSFRAAMWDSTICILAVNVSAGKTFVESRTARPCLSYVHEHLAQPSALSSGALGLGPGT